MSDGEWQTVGPKKKPSIQEMKQKELQARITESVMERYHADMRGPERPKSKKELKEEELVRQKKEKEQLAAEKKEVDGEDRAFTVKKISHEKKQELMQLRQKKGLNQKELAYLMQQSQKVMTDMENGKSAFDAGLYNRTIQKLRSLPDKKKEDD